ncbi:hypothetical protein D3C77_261330 [compost metagenome]
MRQVTGRRQDFVMALDLHVLDIGLQRTPEPIDQRQSLRVGFSQWRENHFMASEQGSIGGFHPALLGTGNRVPRHEVRQLFGKRLARSTHHIALGAADVGEHRTPKVKLRQARQELFHGQDRHGQLNDISANTGSSQVLFAAVDHPQLHRQLARLRIQVDTDHLAAQAAFAQALGERAANEPETDHHQATDKRLDLVYHDFNHGAGPYSNLHARHSLPQSTALG